MHVRLFGRDFRLMSTLLNLVVDRLSYVQSMTCSKVVETSQSVRQAGRQLIYIFMYHACLWRPVSQ